MSCNFNSRTFGKASSKPASTFRGNAPKVVNAFMPCGVHKRPAGIPAKPRGSYDQPRRPAQQYKRVLEEGEMRGSCICDYHDYPTLRYEREYASETVTGKPLRFIELPTEIRKQIFANAILFDGVIEFCPEPFQYSGFGKLKGCSEEFLDACAHQYRTVGPKVGAAGTLMRTCRQYNEDITEDFYSSNEFRFSNVRGWFTLDIFLNMIGMHKAAMLRKLSVCHPEMNVLPRSYSTLGTFSQGQLYIREFGGVIDGPGFKTYSKKRWFDEKKISKDPTLVLEKIGKLKELRWVIPEFSYHSIVIDMDSPIDERKFEDLTVTWAAVHTKEVYTYLNYHDPQVMMYSSTEHRAEALAEAYTKNTGRVCKFEDHWLEQGDWIDSVSGQTQRSDEDVYDGIEDLFGDD